jgi:hypothetical protein
MNRISIFWNIISHSLPKVKQYANDRIPTVEKIKKLTKSINDVVYDSKGTDDPRNVKPSTPL